MGAIVYEVLTFNTLVSVRIETVCRISEKPSRYDSSKLIKFIVHMMIETSGIKSFLPSSEEPQEEKTDEAEYHG